MSSDATGVLRVAEQLLALGVVHSSLQTLWCVVQTRSRPQRRERIAEDAAIDMTRSSAHRRWAIAFTGPIALAVLLVRVLCALVLLWPTASDAVRTGALLTLVGAHVVFAWTPFGVWPDGGEGMARLVTVALVVVRIAGSSAHVAGARFLAASVALAYVASGAHKIRAAGWRSGETLRRVCRSQHVGHPALSRLIDRMPTWTVRVLSRTLIAWELTFPLVFIMPTAWVRVALAIGLAFHLGNAILFGINGFPFPFLATYPAVWWVTR